MFEYFEWSSFFVERIPNPKNQASQHWLPGAAPSSRFIAGVIHSLGTCIASLPVPS